MLRKAGREAITENEGILALDISSTAIGACWLHDRETITVTFRAADPNRAVRLRHLSEQLVNLQSPPIVVYYRQFVRGDGATRALYGITGIVEAKLAALNPAPVAVLSCPDSTARAWAERRTGIVMHGLPRADLKRATQKAVKDILGVEDLTEDEADATLLALFTRSAVEEIL